MKLRIVKMDNEGFSSLTPGMLIAPWLSVEYANELIEHVRRDEPDELNLRKANLSFEKFFEIFTVIGFTHDRSLLALRSGLKAMHETDDDPIVNIEP